MSIKNLFDKGLITVAQQPKDNALDVDALGDKNLLFFPIDHDYPGGSASMHNAVFSKYGLNHRSAFVVGNPENAEAIINAFRSDDPYIGGGAGSGFKDKVGEYLDDLHHSAKAIGSVNVIAKENGKLIGYNTDGIGFVNGLLNEYPDCIVGKKVLILGAGGTALPIAYEMAQKCPIELVVANRTVSKAEGIAELVKGFCAARGVGEEAIGEELKNADIVINTSNKGAQPNEMYSAYAPMTRGADPATDMEIAKANILNMPSTAIVADILLEDDTLTMSMARERGNRTHSGRHMNLFQAVPAFKIMTKLNDKDDAEILAIMQSV